MVRVVRVVLVVRMVLDDADSAGSARGVRWYGWYWMVRICYRCSLSSIPTTAWRFDRKRTLNMEFRRT